MTKLNITNKRLYKLKKHKNQSKKNVPKKRKNKKRRQRAGRSFRKRRRKYNIKNMSMKNYKKQKGGVITTKSTDKGNLDTEKVGEVFKSEKLKEKETELKDVQRKILELGNVFTETNDKIRPKRVRLTTNNELINELKELYNDMKNEVVLIPEKIEQIQKLHKDIDDDVKELSVRQMKALKLNADIKHNKAEITLIEPLYRTAKSMDNKFKKAEKDKDKNVKKLEKDVITDDKLKKMEKNTENMHEALGPLEKESDDHQKQITDTNESEDHMEEEEKKKLLKEFTGKRNASQKKYGRAKKNYDKALENFNSKKTNSDKAKTEIDKLNNDFNTNYETKKTKDDVSKIDFIDAHLKGDQMMQGEAKNALTYLEVIEYALNNYKKENATIKVEAWKTLERKSEDISAKITAEKNRNKVKSDKDIATETAKKEKLEKEIEALTKKEDEKLKDEEYKIAKRGFKKGEFEGLEGNIKQQENVVKTSQEETEEAKKEEKKLEKKLKKTEDGTFLGFTKERREKRKADAVGAVQGELDAASTARLAKETQEKKAEESLRAEKRWKKGVKRVGSILHSETKSSLIVPHVHDNDIQTRWRMMYNDTVEGKTDKQIDGEDIKKKFLNFLKYSTDSFNVLTDQPYIYNPVGDLAHTTDDKQSNMKDNKDIFYNYYLKKTIKSPDGKEISLVEMISQRMARYINYVMGHNGTDDEKKSHKETITFLNKQIQELFKPTHLSIPIGGKSNFRNYLNEKMQALNFLEILLKQTVKAFPEEDSQRYTDLMGTTIDDQPLLNIFCTYLGECYDINPSQKLLELETQYTNIITPDEEEVIKKGLSEMNLDNNKPCEPPVDDYGELYLRVGKGLELYSKEVLDGEEEEKRKVVEALKKYEENAKETEEIQKQTKGLLQKLERKIKEIKDNKYHVPKIKEQVEEVKKKIHSMGVVAKAQEMKNNTEERAKLAAATDLLNQKKLESEAQSRKFLDAQKAKDTEIEKLLKKEAELKAQIATQKEAVNTCDKESVEEKKLLQEALTKREEELAQAKAATEAAQQDKRVIDEDLAKSQETVADQEAESEDLSRKEERLNRARKELEKSAKPDKEEKGGDEEDDEFDFGGIINEMANRPEKDVEIDFGNNKTVVLMARVDKDGNVQIEQRNIGKGSGIEKEISDYGMGNLEAPQNETIGV